MTVEQVELLATYTAYRDMLNSIPQPSETILESIRLISLVNESLSKDVVNTLELEERLNNLEKQMLSNEY